MTDLTKPPYFSHHAFCLRGKRNVYSYRIPYLLSITYFFFFPIHFFAGSYAEISSGHAHTKLNIKTPTKESCYTNFPSSSLQTNCKHTETCLLQHPKQLNLQLNPNFILFFFKFVKSVITRRREALLK